MPVSYLTPKRQVCRPGPSGQRLKIERFVYDAASNVALTWEDLIGIDELIISGSPADNTEIAMPSHTAMQQLFHKIEQDAILSFMVVNSDLTNSVNLVSVNPAQTVHIDADSTYKMYLQIIDASPVTGTAFVEMAPELVGFSGESGVTTQVAAPFAGTAANDNYNALNVGQWANDQISHLMQGLQLAVAIPAITATRLIVMTNNTTVALSVYLEVFAPLPIPIALAASLAPAAVANIAIPDAYFGNMAITAWPTTEITSPGFDAHLGTKVEIQTNTSNAVLAPVSLVDIYAISTVPPGLGDQLWNGPRASAVVMSQSGGYTATQASGYNVGMVLAPLTATVPPAAPVTLSVLSATSTNARTFPNDVTAINRGFAAANANFTLSFQPPIVSL